MHARKKESFKILARLVRPLIPFCVVLAGLLLIRGSAALAKVEFKKAGAIKTTEKKVFIQKAVKLQMPFISNLGQMKDENIRFYTRTFGGVAHITRTGAVVFTFPVVGSNEKAGKNLSKTKSLKSWVLKETFVGAANSNPQGMERAQTKVNYFIGNDRSRWKTNVPTYNSISLGEIYKGIELSLKAYGKTVEKIFTVRQGADPSTIKIRVDGATSLKINDKGELELESGLGVARFSKPLAYQDKNGNRQNVQVAYHVNKNSYGFKPGNYDKSLPLLIDPVLTYSTYVGGSFSDIGRGIAVDDAGNTYITGSTESMADFPTSTGPHHGGSGVGGSTVFVTKLSADGSTLLYSTYLGGIGNDSGTDIAVDGDGNAYVTGRTFSTDFPTTPGAYLTSREGGTSAVISKLSADGSGLLYSTYLGGGGANPDIHQTGWGLAVDTAGYAYVTGYVSAPTGVDPGFPTSAGSLQSSYGGGSDAFMAVLDPAGNGSSDLVYATYLGGNGDENGWDIALDDEGYVYVTGETSSTDFPTTVNSFQSSRSDSTTAAFMTRIDPAGNGLNDLDYSTFLGSNDNSDYGHGIAVDGLGYVYLSGYTYSANFPTMYTLQQKAIDSSADAFVAKIFPAANGSNDLIYSTYLGGSSDDRGHSIALKTNGDAYVTGMTSSSDFPEKNAIQIVSGGNHDAFITRLNFNDTDSQLQLVYSTYLGGNSTDSGWHIAVDDMGNTYVTGSSGSPDFPTTPDGYQISSGGGTDVFVAKISGGTVWYVKPVGAGLQDGTSWDDAFSAIQDAIDAAGEGDEIWVAEGIYILNQNILVNKAVAIYGGFDGTETDRNQRNWANYVTTVDGNNSVNHCFVILANALVDGFTITAAGGVSPGYSGGGIYNQSCDPIIKNCVFTANSNDFGGGLANFNSSPIVTNCIFAGNSAESGGGISNRGTSEPTIANCTLTGNSADNGGGIYNDSSSPTITNSILWDNTATNGPEIYNIGASAPSVTYCNVTGGYSGNGNIDSDPQFEDPAEGNFHLHSDSPSIDTGDNVAVATIPFDFEGETRLFDGDYEETDTVDMGADEYVDEDDDHMADWWELFHFGDLSHDGSGDDDIDALNDLAEYQHKTNPNDPDSDDDGALDGNEIANGTNPNLADSDGDGVNDGTDNCPLVDNPGQEDIDGDGLGDACDDDPVYTGDLYWDFESGIGDWSIDNEVWEIGTPTAGPTACYSGDNCAGTVLSGLYPTNTDSQLTSAALDLPAVSGSDELHVRFWQWFSYSSLDSGLLRISVWDAGSGIWQPWENVSTPVVSTSGAWSRTDVDVSAYASERVRFGFYHEAVDNSGIYGGDNSHGWFIDDIQVVTVSVIGSLPPFSEDFEGGLGDWSVDQGVWEIGTPTAGPTACYSGDNCAGTVLSGLYPTNTDSQLTSAALDLPAVSGSDELHVRFWQWFSYSSLDSGLLRISVWDAGSGIWQPWENVSTPVVSTSGAWSRTDVDVSAYASERVRFGFYHEAVDNSGIYGGDNSHGWFIDDIQVVTVSVIGSLPPFSEDFEGGLGDWSVDQGVWEIGTPTAGPTACYSGDNCAGTVLSGLYPTNTDSQLTSAALDLPAVSGSDELHVRFWQWFSYSSLDSGLLRISVWDAGSGIWQPWENVSTPVVSTSGAWSRTDVDVSAYASERVRFGFYHEAVDNSGIYGGDNSHGWFIDDIQVVTVSVIGSLPPFSEDFEGGLGDWSVDQGVWEIGTPTAGPTACYSGDNCAGTVLSGLYPTNTDSQLTSAALDLPAVSGSDELHVRFWQWFSYSSLDSGLLRISVWDAGSGIWQPWENVSTPVVSTSGAWSRTDVDVSAYASERVRFGFYHEAVDNSGIYGGDNSHGWFIDDIQVVTVSVIGSLPPFSEDFEGGLGDWSVDQGVWEIGTPTAGPTACYSGDNCAGTVLSGLYPTNTDSQLTSAALDLPAVSGSDELHVRFWQWFSYSSLDSGLLRISVWDAGSGIWQPWENVSTPVVSTSGAWSRTDVDVSAYASERVRFGFYHEAVDNSGIYGGDNSHGWFIDDIQVVTVSVIGSLPPFSEDFEGGLGDWSVDQGVWEIGTPTAGPTACYSGDNCAGTVLSGLYPTNTDSQLTSAALDLPAVSGSDELHVRFWQWFSYSSLDSGLLRISVWDAGSGIWQPWENVSTPVVSTSGAWSRTDVDVSAYASERVRFGFYHEAVDNSGIYGGDNSHGWFIDDIQVVTVSVIGSLPPFSEDFEGGLGDWSVDQGVWEIGTPTAGPTACYSGDNCAGTVLSGLYPTNTDSQLTSAALDLPAVSGSDELHVRFWQWFSYSSLDSGLLRISVWDAGSGIWQPWENVSTPVVSTSGAWSRTDVDVSAYASERVRFGFYHEAVDNSGIYGGDNSHGWFIDDIEMITSAQPLDGDGDDLPDSWEQQIIDYDTGDSINTIYDVNPEDDFDGDWVSNQREYGNYTDPTDSGEFTPPGTGAIRGTVNDSGGSPITTNDILLQVITGDPCGGWQQIDDVITSDGNYIFVGLDHNQDYWVRSDNMWQSNYVNEWYSSPSSSIECNGAQLVDVPENGSADGIDFQLDMGTEVSGIVDQADGTTPIQVVAFRANDPCQGHTWSVGTQTDISDGSFTLKGVPVGTASVYLNTDNMNQSNNVNEWWRNVGSTSDCSLAELLDIPAGGVNDLSFQLDLGGSVSGYVTDALDNLIPNLWVQVNDSLCGNGQWFGGDETDEFGYYKIWGIPESDDVFVQTCANCWGLNWVDEWWDGVGNTGSIDCNGAAPIPISPGIDIDGIDFQLVLGETLTGRVTETDGTTGIANVCVDVFADRCWSGHYRGTRTNSDGTFTISGIPPDDEVYVKADGPCATINYVIQWYGGGTDCNSAQPVTSDATNVNFILEAAGSISGHVQGTLGVPIIDLHIYAQDYDTGEWLAGSNTDEFGDYKLLGLPTGNYRLRTASYNTGLQFADEYYDNVYYWDGASPVSVTAPAETPIDDIILEVGNTISGTITGLAANQHVHIRADSDSGTPDDETDDLEFWTDISGSGSGTDSYTIQVVPDDGYRVEFNPDNAVRVFYRSGDSDGTWVWADATLVNAGSNVDLNDLTITDGGAITGQVTDGTSAIEGVWVEGFTGRCWDNWVGGAHTDANGNYTIAGLPPVGVFVHAYPEGGNLFEEWYDGGVGTQDCNSAMPIAVTSGVTETLDFVLETGFSIQGSVMNVREPGNIFRTYIEVAIENDFVGNLPADISSIEVKEPGGSTIASYPGNLAFTPQWNSFFVDLAGSPNLGVYTFSVTSTNATATTTDHQYILRTLPLQDINTFSPASGSTIDSKTPSFSWDAVNYETEDIAIYYRLEIWDENIETRVFATDRTYDMLSYTVPEGKLVPGTTYNWRVRIVDNDTWEYVENRTNSDWSTFTVAGTLVHTNKPAIFPDDWLANTYSTENSSNVLLWVRVLDHDGVASDGSSHQVTVTLPGGSTIPMRYDRTDAADIVAYYAWDNNPPASGQYSFTVSDPDNNVGTLVEDYTSNPLDIPDENALTPSNKNPISENITATFDNVYVNGNLYDNFDTYNSIDEIDFSKWKAYFDNASIVGGALVLNVNDVVGRGHGALSFTYPETINSIRADITVNSISDPDGPPRAEIKGSWCNNGTGEVFGGISVVGNRVYYGLSEDYLIDRNKNYTWNDLVSGELMTGITPGQTITVEVALSGNTMTFSANGNTASYAIPGPIYPVREFNDGKQLRARINLVTDTTPTFTWAPVAGANRYGIRIYNWDRSRRSAQAWPGNVTSYTFPPGILPPNGYFNYRFEAWDAPSPLNVDNVSKTPASNDDNYRFYTGSQEAVDPFIDLRNGGVRTWNDPVNGPHLAFWIKVHDAQGVPDNIMSVKVQHPSGAVTDLESWCSNNYSPATPTSCIYENNSDQPIESGNYTFIVEDLEGHIFSIPEDLNPDVIDFPAVASLSPVDSTILNNTAVDFDWADVTGATFYSLDIYDYDYNLVYTFHTTESEFHLAEGFLKDQTLYRWRVKTRREYFSDNTDNNSSSPNYWNMLTFTSTALTDTDNDGMPDEWENIYPGLDPGLDDASGDLDSDGLTNLEEYQKGTDPNNPDSENDGMPDGWEADNNLNPLLDDANQDPDSDILTNLEEFQVGTDPNNSDTDGDGVDDGEDNCPLVPNPNQDDINTNGIGDACEDDADGDGYIDENSGGDDCNDLDATIHPDAAEIPGDLIDQDCDGSDTVDISPGTYYVDPVNGTDNTTHGTGSTDQAWKSMYYAVQLINAGAPGTYTLNLAAGTYSIAGGEPDKALNLNQNIEIIGAGQGVTILDGAGAANWKSAFTIYNGAPDVRVQDLTIRNFENGIALSSDGGCYFFTNMEIKLCTTGLQIVDGHLLKVDFSGTVISENTTGIKQAAGSSNNLILYGTVSNNSGDGIIIYDGSGHEIHECTITGNNTSETAYGGVAVIDASAILRRNVIEGNRCHGVFADDGLSTQHLDATYNYWGDGDGPSGEGPGTAGDAVSEHVDFIPWFAAIPSDDTDGDSLADDSDNCPANANADQADYDDDGIGDVCDPDADGDGFTSTVVGGLDCNDNDAFSYPGATEVPNDTLDQDCDGSDLKSDLTPATYYVDPVNGNDDATHGTDPGVQAWKTIKFAVEMINNGSAGDYILTLAPGTYSPDSEVLDIPLTLEQNVTINGSGAVLDGSGNQDSAQNPWTMGFIVSPGASNITIQNLTIENFEQGLVVQSDGGCVDLIDVVIGSCDTGLKLVGSYQTEIDLQEPPNSSVITGCTTGIEITADSAGNTIRNGTVSNNTGDGIVVDASNVAPSDNLITDIDVLDNAKTGIVLRGGAGTQVTDCLISGNNSGIDQDGYGGIAVLACCASLKWNTIENNQCSGIYADEASSLDIHGNLIRENREGIRLGFTSDVTIQNNTITENLDGLVIEEGSSPDVTCNIVWNNGITTDLVVNGNFDRLQFNDVGTTNLPDLPPTNISLDPQFKNPATGDYSLAETSPCIDGTDLVDAGRDITGATQRPLGDTWDMGAYESPGYPDLDGDRMPDWWEQRIIDADPDDDIDSFDDVIPDSDPLTLYSDFDNDGVSNQDEYEAGTDPTTSLVVTIDDPAENLTDTADTSIVVSGTASDATAGITMTLNGDPIITWDPGTETWSHNVNLDPAVNIISVTASNDDQSITAGITVMRDNANPQVSITVPENLGAHETTAEVITVSGLASDDTRVASVSWSRIAGSDTAEGDAVGTDSYSAMDIPLVEAVDNVITVTAIDSYGNAGSATITVTRLPGVNSEEINLTPPPQPPVDPLDLDGDQYLNSDETHTDCGTDPNDDGSVPDNYSEDNGGEATRYPIDPLDPDFDAGTVIKDENGAIIGAYKWPDCLNPDDDGDNLPDTCEDKYPGFNSHDPSDDPAGDPDGDGWSNLVECQNNTDPFTAEVAGFSVEVVDIISGQSYDNWLPVYEGVLRIEMTWTGGGTPPAQISFSLQDTSRHQGRAVNDPNPATADTDYPSWYDFNGFDFGLTTTNPATNPSVHSFDQELTSVAGVGGVYTAYVQCWDYGASTRVVATVPGVADTRAEIWLPTGSGGSGISNAWIHDRGAHRLDPNADIDKVIFDKKEYPAEQGDDFNNFEEYRGIIYTQPVGGARQHARLNPHRKDLFLRAVGYDPVTAPFALGDAFTNAGIDIHNTTDWGHDATQDGAFFTYYREAGAGIESISQSRVVGEETQWASHWPKREWEFKLDIDPATDWTPITYWASPTNLTLAYTYPGTIPDPGSRAAYTIRKPLPHINVLIVRHDPTSPSSHVNQDGYINFISAISPSQDNRLGTRIWTWDHKGHCSTNSTEDQPTMYGLPVTYQVPLDHLFGDRPYVEGTVWTDPGWTAEPVINGLLAPLSEVEDQTDQGIPINGVIAEDQPNTTWDGDYRMEAKDTWENPVQMNPFDIDNDGYMELPMAADPAAVAGIVSIEADKETVLRHTITHEIAHALAGPAHTEDVQCLMHREAIDWQRDHYFSDFYRSLLRIHNRVR